MSDEIFGIEIDGEYQNLSLADIMGIDTSQINEFRGGGRAPAGIYEWRITDCGFDSMEVNDRQLGEKVMRPFFAVKLEALACRACKDPSVDPTALVGITHSERVFLKDLRKDLGRVKSFFVDIGLTGPGSYADHAQQAVGAEFVAPITHSKDKNDPDRIYANLDFNKIEPLAGAAVPAGGAPPQGLAFGAKS